MDGMGQAYRSLASYQSCTDRIAQQWHGFTSARNDRLRHGDESEKVAEAILDDLFTGVLDWSKGDLTYQISFSDIVLTHNLAKYLILEVKRPGSLFPGRRAFDSALDQARRYAAEQRVPRIAVSDGCYLYAADIQDGGLKDRLLIDLACADPPLSLWWLSMHGIYRPCSEPVAWPVAQEAAPKETISEIPSSLLHPKYKLPASCFAYVGDASRPATWKLPYRLGDGSIDDKRLPKAIQALLSNYRGAKVGGIPQQALAAVLHRLADAADTAGRMPPRAINTAPIYRQLARVLEQISS